MGTRGVSDLQDHVSFLPFYYFSRMTQLYRLLGSLLRPKYVLVGVLRGSYVGLLITPIEEPGDDARLTHT